MDTARDALSLEGRCEFRQVVARREVEVGVEVTDRFGQYDLRFPASSGGSSARVESLGDLHVPSLLRPAFGCRVEARVPDSEARTPSEQEVDGILVAVHGCPV